MNKRRLLIVTVAACAALLILIGVSLAYFNDHEVKDNEITIGNVSIKLSEGGFDPTETYEVIPGTRVVKAPKLKNTGSKDEFVFMRITVPKADGLTLLNESSDPSDSSVKRGQPKSGLSSAPQQLFKLIADRPTPDTVKSVPAVAGMDIDFTYHSDTAAGNTVDGWTLLNVDRTSSEYDEYVFGYNKKLAPTDETVTLFDAVQLKSFIDGEVSGNTEIGVKCYGIQADNLKPSESGVDLTAEHLDEASLRAVYTIVKNKANE